MAQEVRLIVSDGATVQVLDGEEYGDRHIVDVPTERANQRELLERAKDALPAIQQHIDDVQAELAGWASKDAAGVKDSLGVEVLPALVYALRVCKQVARLVADVYDGVD